MKIQECSGEDATRGKPSAVCVGKPRCLSFNTTWKRTEPRVTRHEISQPVAPEPVVLFIVSDGPLAVRERREKILCVALAETW